MTRELTHVWVMPRMTQEGQLSIGQRVLAERRCGTINTLPLPTSEFNAACRAIIGMPCMRCGIYILPAPAAIDVVAPRTATGNA